MKKLKISKTGKVIYNGKVLKHTIDRFGYHSVRMNNEEGKRRRYMVHRLVAQKYLENPLNKKEVHHKNNNPHDNRLCNLEWVTPKENCRYSALLGRRNKKLSLSDANKIIDLLSSGNSQYKIAKMFGINQSCISDIKTGVSWSWLKDEKLAEGQ